MPALVRGRGRERGEADRAKKNERDKRKKEIMKITAT